MLVKFKTFHAKTLTIEHVHGSNKLGLTVKGVFALRKTMLGAGGGTLTLFYR
jgi:hypothetical protein